MGDVSKDEKMDDEQFENVYGEKLRVRLEKKRKNQGVSYLIDYNKCDTIFKNSSSRALPRHHRIHRDASVHVPQIPHLFFWPTD